MDCAVDMQRLPVTPEPKNCSKERRTRMYCRGKHNCHCSRASSCRTTSEFFVHLIVCITCDQRCDDHTLTKIHVRPQAWSRPLAWCWRLLKWSALSQTRFKYVRVVFVLENFEASSGFEECNWIFYQRSWKSHLLVPWRDLTFCYRCNTTNMKITVWTWPKWFNRLS